MVEDMDPFTQVGQPAYQGNRVKEMRDKRLTS
jgi:hypothetical protein